MPNSIVRIGCNAFNYCESLKQIVIPNSVEVIEDGAFANCYSLESVRLPKSIKQLGDSLFNECDELKHIIIPIGTKDIFVKLLPEYKDKLEEQNRGWRVKETRPFSPEEIAAVARAEVMVSQYGNSVCFFMNTGGKTYIPLLSTSSLTVGDSVNLKTAKLVTLCREGKEDIYRVIE